MIGFYLLGILGKMKSYRDKTQTEVVRVYRCGKGLTREEHSKIWGVIGLFSILFVVMVT